MTALLEYLYTYHYILHIQFTVNLFLLMYITLYSKITATAVAVFPLSTVTLLLAILISCNVIDQNVTRNNVSNDIVKG